MVIVTGHITGGGEEDSPLIQEGGPEAWAQYENAGLAEPGPDEIAESKILEGMDFVLDGSGIWEASIFTRERGQWFHWKTADLFDTDRVRFVVKLRSVPGRSPKHGNWFGYDWPRSVSLIINGRRVMLYKKADWIPGSPRKYWSGDILMSNIGLGKHGVSIDKFYYKKDDPDPGFPLGYDITVREGVRESAGKQIIDTTVETAKKVSPFAGATLIIIIILLVIVGFVYMKGGV